MHFPCIPNTHSSVWCSNKSGWSFFGRLARQLLPPLHSVFKRMGSSIIANDCEVNTSADGKWLSRMENDGLIRQWLPCKMSILSSRARETECGQWTPKRSGRKTPKQTKQPTNRSQIWILLPNSVLMMGQDAPNCLNMQSTRRHQAINVIKVGRISSMEKRSELCLCVCASLSP